MKGLKTAIATIVCLLFVGLPAVSAHGWGKFHRKRLCKVNVMTRNLYVGADIFQVVDAAAAYDPEDPATFFLIPIAVAEVFQTVQQTNFPERAQAIANEIWWHKPHFIGLQEVSIFYRQSPGDAIVGGISPAETVVYDYLEELLHALQMRRLQYKVAAVVTNADVEFPMLVTYNPDNPFASQLDDVRLVDRDVILVREDLHVSDEFAKNYDFSVPIPSPGGDIPYDRGYAAVTAEICGEGIRFYNTHLETRGESSTDPMVRTFFQQVQALQMAELLSQVSSEDIPVLLVGDFNSGPDNFDDTVPNLFGGGEIPSPYRQAHDAGLVDIWYEKMWPSPGLTCCFNETVDDPFDSLYERVDMIFLDSKDLGRYTVRARTTGDKIWNLTFNGLWPSDHAGVAAKLKFFRWNH